MDLISREAINNLEKGYTKGSDYDRGWNDALYAADALPSAFEDMTNGEVIQALFPNPHIETMSHTVWVGHDGMAFKREWWNAPYKAESEGT